MEKTAYSFDDIDPAIKTYLNSVTQAVSSCQEALGSHNYLFVHDLCSIAMANLKNVRFYAAKIVDDTNDFGGVA